MKVDERKLFEVIQGKAVWCKKIKAGQLRKTGIWGSFSAEVALVHTVKALDKMIARRTANGNKTATKSISNKKRG